MAVCNQTRENAHLVSMLVALALAGPHRKTHLTKICLSLGSGSIFLKRSANTSLKHTLHLPAKQDFLLVSTDDLEARCGWMIHLWFRFSAFRPGTHTFWRCKKSICHLWYGPLNTHHPSVCFCVCTCVRNTKTKTFVARWLSHSWPQLGACLCGWMTEISQWVREIVCGVVCGYSAYTNAFWY